MSEPRQRDDRTPSPHLTLCFTGDGVTCYPEGPMDQECVRLLALFVNALHADAKRILCALRLCETAEGDGHVH